MKARATAGSIALKILLINVAMFVLGTAFGYWIGIRETANHILEITK